MTVEYSLVRDNLIYERDESLFEVCDNREEVVKFAIKKLYDLVFSLADGDCRDLDVYADMMELIFHIGEISNIHPELIEQYTIEKLNKEGGFSKFLIRIEK